MRCAHNQRTAPLALVEERRDRGAVAVDAERELRQVVRADREAVEDLREARRRGARSRGSPPSRTPRGRRWPGSRPPSRIAAMHLRAFFGRPAERDHHVEVRQAERLAHALHRGALEQEAFLVARVVVAARAAPAEHRVLLDGLERRAADELRVLVRLEVAEAQDDRARVERGGDHRDALRQAVDEELGLVFVARGHAIDLGARSSRPAWRSA